MQVAIQVATMAVMALKGRPTTGTNMANVGEVHRPRHGEPALRQTLVNFEMK